MSLKSLDFKMLSLSEVGGEIYLGDSMWNAMLNVPSIEYLRIGVYHDFKEMAFIWFDHVETGDPFQNMGHSLKSLDQPGIQCPRWTQGD